MRNISQAGKLELNENAYIQSLDSKPIPVKLIQFLFEANIKYDRELNLFWDYPNTHIESGTKSRCHTSRMPACMCAYQRILFGCFCVNLHLNQMVCHHLRVVRTRSGSIVVMRSTYNICLTRRTSVSFSICLPFSQIMAAIKRDVICLKIDCVTADCIIINTFSK